MTIPDTFQFSQACLQDYLECQRRFELRYWRRLAWPAATAEPIGAFEAQMRRGELFHRLVHQHQSGVDEERLGRAAAVAAEAEPDPDDAHLLLEWWSNYLRSAPADLPPLRFPEVTLSAPMGRRRLIAKFDLIALDPAGEAVIVDWKTSRRRPRRETLVERMQTRVYRYLLARAGADLAGGVSIPPERIRMIYWFAGEPEAPEILPYDAVQFEADGLLLDALTAEIEELPDGPLPLTDDVRKCRFCEYRSLCGRGDAAGSLQDSVVEGDPWLDEPGAVSDAAGALDFEQIAEIAF